MHYKIIIPDKLDSANDYIKANRTHYHKANKMKKDNQRKIALYLRQALGDTQILSPIHINFHWHEKNKKRDLDNIAFAKKFIQDSLVYSGYLEDDGWSQIYSFADYFYIDNKNPRVEVEIIELGERGYLCGTKSTDRRSEMAMLVVLDSWVDKKIRELAKKRVEESAGKSALEDPLNSTLNECLVRYLRRLEIEKEGTKITT